MHFTNLHNKERKNINLYKRKLANLPQHHNKSPVLLELTQLTNILILYKKNFLFVLINLKLL